MGRITVFEIEALASHIGVSLYFEQKQNRTEPYGGSDCF